MARPPPLQPPAARRPPTGCDEARSNIYLSNASRQLCDFHTNDIHKFLTDAEKRLSIGFFADAYSFTERFKLSTNFLRKIFAEYELWDNLDDDNYTGVDKHYDAACQLLLDNECQGGSTADDCWQQAWVQNNYFYNGQTLVIVFICIFCFLVIYIPAAGDDGYTSGINFGDSGYGLNPVMLIIELIGFVLKLPVFVARIVATLKALLCCQYGFAATPHSAQSVPVIQAQESSDAVTNLVDGVSSITFGRKNLVCSNGAAYIAVPLVRIGEAKEGCTVSVILSSGTAAVDHEFGQVAAVEGCRPVRGGAIIDFPPAMRLATIYIRLLAKPTLATGDLGTSEFTVSLSNVQPATAIIGPITVAVVRLVDLELYPDNLDIPRHKLLRTQHAKKHYGVADGSTLKKAVRAVMATNLLAKLRSSDSVPTDSEKDVDKKSALSSSTYGDYFGGGVHGSSHDRGLHRRKSGAELLAEEMANRRAENLGAHWGAHGNEIEDAFADDLNMIKTGSVTAFGQADLESAKVEVSSVFSGFGKSAIEGSSKAAQQIRKRATELLKNKGDLGREYDFDFSENFGLIYSFFRRSFRIKGLVKKVIIHQSVYFLMEGVDGFCAPLAYSTILDYGLVQKNRKWTWLVALGMMSWSWVKYHIKLNYFHGSMLVMQHLRAALLRKYAEGTAAALCTAALCTAAALGSAAALCTA